MPLCSLEEALEDLKAGKMLIVVDDESRENEGDLVMAAEKVTPEAINFIVKYGKGLLCMPTIGERLDELQMPLMISQNAGRKDQTAFTVSVDYNRGTTTGISAYDRAATVKAMLDPESRPGDFTRPGHMFPLRYHPGGVLARPGHTEAIVDLCNLAGLYPAGIVCEMMDDDGTMSRLPQLEQFADTHGLKILSIAQIIAHRRHKERLIERVAETRLPTRYGEFKAIGYRSYFDQGEHIALTTGKWNPDDPVLVRIHSECLTGDVFGSLRCDCGEQLGLALKELAKEGAGRPALYEAGRARYRPAQQNQGVLPPGQRTGYRRGQPDPRLRRRYAALRSRRPDPPRPRRFQAASSHQQPQQDGRPLWLRPGNPGPCSLGGIGDRRKPQLPDYQETADGAPAGQLLGRENPDE